MIFFQGDLIKKRNTAINTIVTHRKMKSLYKHIVSSIIEVRTVGKSRGPNLKDVDPDISDGCPEFGPYVCLCV